MKKSKPDETPIDQQFALFAPAPEKVDQTKPKSEAQKQPESTAAVKPEISVTVPAKTPRPKQQRSVTKRTKTQPKKSGTIPEGDVRMTANIRADLHLKLKITAATRRTTIGELIEGLVEKYLK